MLSTVHDLTLSFGQFVCNAAYCLYSKEYCAKVESEPPRCFGALIALLSWVLFALIFEVLFEALFEFLFKVRLENSYWQSYYWNSYLNSSFGSRLSQVRMEAHPVHNRHAGI